MPMNATQRTKALLKDAFPSLWVRWYLAQRPKSAERELDLLDRIVPRQAVTVDVGANCGLYTRKLARLSRKVYAFEPSHEMAQVLRRTSASNVNVHEIALSDRIGEAELFTPKDNDNDKLVHSLASLEPRLAAPGQKVASTPVPMARLDAILHEDVAFVKIDVEGHELNVLNGAVELLEKSQPVFLVEAEDRHRARATGQLFEFFDARSYHGYFLAGGEALPVDQFRVEVMQDVSALLSDGGRKTGKRYINNFFFFPRHLDGEAILKG
jgi:FkbM family methyltransferase